MSWTQVLTEEVWAGAIYPPPDRQCVAGRAEARGESDGKCSVDSAIAWVHGRSRGGWTTKTHALVESRGLPPVVVVTPGQAGESPALPKLLAER